MVREPVNDARSELPEPQQAVPAELQVQIIEYIGACRQRVPAFIDSHYSVRGAFRLNRRAWGRDVLVAPFNFLMAIPNFILAIISVVLDLVGARRPARWLHAHHLGLRTAVQQKLESELMHCLLELPAAPGPADAAVRELARQAAREPLAIYLRTRDIAGEITAGLLAAVVGLTFFSQFTPGSISAGTVFAQAFAREQAVSNFLLGDFLGGLYYDLFPVQPSLTVVLLSILVVILTLAVVSAFAGILHDPVQRWLGIHQRRLHGLLDAIEAAMRNPRDERGYRPRDTFYGRIQDLLDWVRGLLHL